MAFFFLVVSGTLFASSTGDNITEATEMAAIRVVQATVSALIKATILVDPEPTVTASPMLQ